MPTITPRGGRYRAEVRIKGRAISRTFPDRRGAQLWAAEQERAILAGNGAAALTHGWTLGMLVHHCIAHLPRSGLRDERGAEQRLEWWRTHYGHVALADITPALVAEARDKLLRGVTPRGGKRSGSTVNRYLAALSSAMRAAIRRYHVADRNPVRDVEREHEGDSIGRALDRDEQRALLAACDEQREPELRVAILVALTTGLRRGELDRLTWSDIDFVRGIARIHLTKNGHARAVPLPTPAVAALQEWRKLHPGIGGARVLLSGVDWLYRKAQKLALECGLGKVRWHDFRHSALTGMALAGATLPELAAIAGHRTLAMVARYQHLAEAPPRAAADRAAVGLD